MVNYYFMVCESLHEERTKPLYNTVIKRIKDCGDNFYCLGGFEAIDEIPVIKVCDFDDYYSCVEKIESVFQRDWDDADWHMICDDDTFVHTGNLNSFISRLPEDNLRIYCSYLHDGKVGIFGGSGILMNNKTFKLIQDHVRENGWQESRDRQNHSDIALGEICYRINRKVKAANSKNEKIFISHPKTMYAFNHTSMPRNQKKVNVGGDLITVHIKDVECIWNDFNENECTYQSLENAFCKH